MNKVLLFLFGLCGVAFVVIRAQQYGAGGYGVGQGYGGYGQQQGGGIVLQDYIRLQNAYNLVRTQNARVDPDRYNFVSEILGGRKYFIFYFNFI